MKNTRLMLATLAGMAFMSSAGDAGSDTAGAGAGTPPPPAPTPSPAPAAKLTAVRLLVDCEHGKCNDVVELGADEAKAAKAAGMADDSKAAVAYARSLKAKAEE